MFMCAPVIMPQYIPADSGGKAYSWSPIIVPLEKKTKKIFLDSIAAKYLGQELTLQAGGCIMAPFLIGLDCAGHNRQGPN
jgi:hypothetical protein